MPVIRRAEIPNLFCEDFLFATDPIKWMFDFTVGPNASLAKINQMQKAVECIVSRARLWDARTRFSSMITSDLHPCLAIEDIRYLIFDAFASTRRCQLAALARTCKAFTDTALNILWRYQYTLGPLVQTMPSDLWEIYYEEDGDTIHRSVKFTRDLRDTDWERVVYYGAKVQALLLRKEPLATEATPTPFVHLESFIALSAYRPVTILLPNLRYLCMDLYIPRMLSVIRFIPSLIGFRVSSIELYADSPPIELLKAVHRVCPYLTTIRVLRTNASTIGCPTILSQFVRAFPKLREVELDKLIPTRELFNHLSRLTTLTSCTLSLPFTKDDEPFHLQRDDFPRLTSFSLAVKEWEFAIPLLSGLCSPLQSIKLHAHKSASIESMDQLLQAIARQFPLLQTLYIQDRIPTNIKYIDDENPTARVNSAMQAFSHLFFLRYLRHLTLNVPFVLNLYDTTLSEIASTWPLLEALELLPGLGNVSFLTLEGLIPIIANCWNLSTLNINLRCEPFNIRRLKGVSNWRIRHIDFENSYIHSPVAVFRCLVGMFPLLTIVDAKGHRREWAKVESLLEGSLMHILKGDHRDFFDA